MNPVKKELEANDAQSLLTILKTRFEKNMPRHETIQWADVAAKLQSEPTKLWSLSEMENTGGEPDVIGYDAQTQTFIFCDCAAESPKGRRSVCYDHEALHARKEHKPANSAVEMAKNMGISILTETEYRTLQEIGLFDLKTSSWISTPDTIRKLGGAVFCDRRYNQVFLYHNGAESYYAARGFRGILKV
ncbi:DUF4256 domain-containing protein [Pedobacter sp. MW01-1-1]|uniref:DUF4256 domain-containing protein n=1 Tax=Pedobacter sp. MW01-1-1 TaxID=3383027 RepID=UPI003FF02A8D